MPKPPADCTSMTDVREAIDELDRQIVDLIARRAQYVRVAAAHKTSEAAVAAPQRVKAMLEQRRQWAEHAGVSPDLIEATYRTMVEHFIAEETDHFRNRK